LYQSGQVTINNQATKVVDDLIDLRAPTPSAFMTCDSPEIQRNVFVSVNSDPQLNTTDFSIQEFASGEEQQEQQPLQFEQEKVQDL
jgi:hypothetical protein